MHCIDRRAALGLGVALWLAGCASPEPPPPAPVLRANVPNAGTPPPTRLANPNAPRSWDELRMQAARRILAANPGITYSGVPPDPLLAIPVLEIELNGDGSIRRIDVLREPRQARETTQIAIDAVRRAAPFGDVSRLPRPWKFAETFLFNEERKFKPRTLDS